MAVCYLFKQIARYSCPFCAAVKFGKKFGKFGKKRDFKTNLHDQHSGSGNKLQATYLQEKN